MVIDGSALRGVDSYADCAYRLQIGSAAGTGYSADRYRAVGLDHVKSYVVGHLFDNRKADSTIFVDAFFFDKQHVLFHFVAVGNDTAFENSRCAGNGG